MRHFRRHLLIATLLLSSSCQPRPTAPLESRLVPRPLPPKPAARLARTQKLVPTAAGRGDFLLDNGLVSATVLGLAHAGLAGSLAHPRSGLTPHQLGPLAPRLSGRPIRFQRVYLTRGESASVRLEGAAEANGGLSVQLAYALPRGSRKIHISLRLRRVLGSGPWRGEVALRLALGRTRAFVPGHGYASMPQLCEPWLELHARPSSYALSCAHGWTLRHDANGGIISSRVVTSSPGKTLRYQATLTIAGRGLSAALRPLLTPRPSGTVARLNVLDERGEPLGQAVVDAWQHDRLEARGVAGKDGRVALSLRPGLYRLRAFSRGRQASSALSLSSRGLRHTLRASAPSQLVFDLRRDAQRREAVQLRLEASKGPITPYLLGTSPLAGAHSWVAPAGRGVIPLPPGRYRVTVVRPFAPPRSHDLALAPFRGAELLSRPPNAAPLRPACSLLVDAVTASFFAEGDLNRWAEAAGCHRSADPTRSFPNAPEAHARLLRALGAPSPAWPRSARPGADVRHLPRAFVLPSAAASKSKGARPACVFYSEGPIFQATRQRDVSTVRVRLPAGFRLEKAVQLKGGTARPAAPRSPRAPHSFDVEPGDASSAFGLSAKSPRGGRIFAFMEIHPHCFSSAPAQGAPPSGASNP